MRTNFSGRNYNMEKVHYLVPDYVLKYKCSMCGRCCCTNWSIVIDKATLKYYQKIAGKDKKIASELASYIKKNQDGTGKIVLNYDVNKVNKNNILDFIFNNSIYETESKSIALERGCPFLTGDRKCSIQLKYGHDALSDTCKVYPRRMALTERGWELSLYFSCPTAAELLREKRPIEFYQDPKGFKVSTLYELYDRIGDIDTRRSKGKANYYQVEEVLIDIMQSRNMDIDSRLIFAGVMIDKLKDNLTEDIDVLLRDLSQYNFDSLKPLPFMRTNMLTLVKDAINERIIMQPLVEDDIRELIRMPYIKSLLMDKRSVSYEQHNQFLKGYNRAYKPAEEDISHIFENYFVNYIFSKKFYEYSYIEGFFIMTFLYVLIRFLVVCKCIDEEKKADEAMVMSIISTVERTVTHVQNYFDTIVKMGRERSNLSLPYIASLINVSN